MKSRKKSKGFNYIIAQDLLDNPPPQPDHIVENLLTTGLTILAAAPKSGKSTLLTHILANTSRGTSVFMNRKTRKSKVLYLGLEDGVSRFSKRLKEFKEKDMFEEASPLVDFYILTETEKTGVDFVSQLKVQIKKESFKIVVIDIMHRIFDPEKRFGFQAEYEMASSLQKCAIETDCAIIVVHHTNKRGKKGLDSISGSSGLIAAMDNIMILSKSSESWSDAYIKLDVQGRDIDPQDIWLEYNLSDMGYVEMSHPPISPNRRNDLKAVADLRIQGLTQMEIAEKLKTSQSSISRYIGQIKSTPNIIGLSEEEAERL